MSIFPKRTIRNSTVTIHWNFNTGALKDAHIYPFVRIGVVDPTGKTTMLLERNVLALPPVGRSKIAGTAGPKSLYLNKNTPLLVLADYLSGPHRKEILADILQHIQDGTHHYFTFHVDADAPLGRYTLISERYCDGHVQHSKTAADDFFLVEQVEVVIADTAKGRAVIVNRSPEKTPVRIVEYQQDGLLPEQVSAFELEGLQECEISYLSPQAFVIYNEERIHLPLWPAGEPTVLRNQQLIAIARDKEPEPAIFLLARENDDATKLTGPSKEIWEHADGLYPASQIKSIDAGIYTEMLAAGLITEFNP
jgi:hypothetical protein